MPPSTISIAAFLKRRCPALRRTPRARLIPMLEWYSRVAGLGVVRIDGKIAAAALARCVRTLDEGASQEYAHTETPDATIIWIENIAATHPVGIPTLLRQALHRFGPRTHFAGHVFTRNDELRLIPADFMQRIAGFAGNPKFQITNPK